MTGRPLHARGARAGRRTGGGVATRADWRGLVEAAKACAADARDEIEGDDATLRLMTLHRRLNGASTDVFVREAGAATADAARAFVGAGRAFARPETPAATRRLLAPSVAELAEFLDQQLTRLADRDFRQAHAGRPEVWR